MKRLHWFGLILLIALAVAIPAIADKAKSFYEKGRDAEARQNYELAYDNYKQAYDLKPTEMRYRVAFERTKFLASASHVHKGQLLRDAGKLEDALKEFQTALSIDSSSFIAQQEVRRTEQMIKESQQAPAPPETKSQTTIDRMLADAAGPVELTPISTQPITMQMTADAKMVYETIGKLAGINVLFDPDYQTQSRTIHISLNGVTLNQALEIVSLESKTFWRPVTPNTIFVAADTQAKRKELEQSVIRTFYLSNLSTPTEIQDVTNSLRQILEITRVQQLPSQGAIIVRGTPDQIALAQKVIDDIDKARPEVVVEVAVMQVSKDKLRQIGIQYPFSQTSNPTITIIPKGGSTSTTTTPTTGTPTTTTNGLTLNDLANLDARNFAVSIPPMSLSLLLNDSTSKTLENPQIRALDGQKATLKIGSRVPVATGSFQPGIGGVGINPLVNTQFQYIDVGVNIDMTPTVHADREVTLKLMFEISSVISTSNIGGIQQPVIGSKHIEQTIRLKDGEVNLLGGLMEASDVRSVAGLPGLAQIPILKYLFGNNSKEITDNEIVFVLVPHIVRQHDVSRQNERAIDVGTANAIELRRDNTPPAPTQQQPATTPTAPAQPPAQQQPQATPPPQAAAPAPNMGLQGVGAVLSFDPPTVAQSPGTTFAVNVSVNGAQNVYSIPAQVNYDPKTLELVNVSSGPFLAKDGQAVALVNRNDPLTGTLNITATRPPGAGGVSGDGQVFTLTFMAKSSGQSNLTISRAQMRDPANQAMPASGAQAVVTVK